METAAESVEAFTVEPAASTIVDSRRLGRNLHLDALRGIAILLVLGRHSSYFPLWNKVGWVGVDLFFVLSGFLISGLIFAEWTRRGTISMRRFYVRRAFKICPSLYVYLATAALLAATQEPLREIAKSIIPPSLFVENYFAYGFSSGHPDLWGHLWSLGVEEHFYLLLPPILWVCAALRRTLDPFGLPILILCPVVGVTCLLARIETGWHLSGDEYLRYAFPTHLRIDGLIFGVLLSYLRHFRPIMFTRFAGSRVLVVFSLLTLLALTVFPLESPLMHTIGFTCVYISCGFLLAATLDVKFAAWSQVVQPLSRLGLYSYSVYLWHILFASVIPQNGLLEFLLYIGAAIGFGIYSAKNVEFFALRYRDRLFPTL